MGCGKRNLLLHSLFRKDWDSSINIEIWVSSLNLLISISTAYFNWSIESKFCDLVLYSLFQLEYRISILWPGSSQPISTGASKDWDSTLEKQYSNWNRLYTYMYIYLVVSPHTAMLVNKEYCSHGRPWLKFSVELGVRQRGIVWIQKNRLYIDMYHCLDVSPDVNMLVNLEYGITLLDTIPRWLIPSSFMHV